MNCPHCTSTFLVMSERQGVEIDYCPQCRGVWLDRGELDMLIERAAQAATTSRTAPLNRPEFADSDYPAPHGTHARRRKSWLSEIFD